MRIFENILLPHSSNLVQSSLCNIHFRLRYCLLCQVVSLQRFCPCHSMKHKVTYPNIWCVPLCSSPQLQPSQACPQSKFDTLLHQSWSTPSSPSLKIIVFPWSTLCTPIAFSGNCPTSVQWNERQMVSDHTKSSIPWCYNQLSAFSDLHLGLLSCQNLQNSLLSTTFGFYFLRYSPINPEVHNIATVLSLTVCPMTCSPLMPQAHISLWMHLLFPLREGIIVLG